MSRALFIDETYLKETSVIDDNVDMKVIRPTVDHCQDYYIHPILGTDLFNDIRTNIVANTVSAAYQTLLNDYIRPCLSYYVQMELMMNNRIKVRNNMTGIPTATNFQPLSFEETKAQMDRLKNKAEWYAERITRFLCENETTYPLYNANSDGDDIIPNETNYTTGLFLGGRALPSGIDIDYGKRKNGWRSRL